MFDKLRLEPGGRNLHRSISNDQALSRVEKWRTAHSENGRCARQLAGFEPSPFDGWRVPLFLCQICGDLGCGAFTVLVSEECDVITWSDFGWIADDNKSILQDPIMRRFGPFSFDRKEYMDRFASYH